MATGTLPPVAAVATLPAEGRAAVLDLLFEPCPQLHALTAELLRSQPFSSYGDLVAAVGRQLADLAASAATADARSLEAILAAHPRLGEARPLSAQSRAEQAQLNAGDDGEAGRLTALNSAYEKAFPGLRYVVFVNGRPRGLIVKDMEERIRSSDLKREQAAAIQAMCEIAVDRANKLAIQ